MAKQSSVLGPGIAATVEGNTLTLVIELDPEGRLSSTGKTKVFSTSSGFKLLPNGQKVSFNVIG